MFLTSACRYCRNSPTSFWPVACLQILKRVYVSWLPTLLNSVLILPARLLILATAATAIRAAISAYSIRSWPRFFLVQILQHVDHLRSSFFIERLLPVAATRVSTQNHFGSEYNR